MTTSAFSITMAAKRSFAWAASLTLLLLMPLGGERALAGDGASASGDPIWIYDSDLYVRHVLTAELSGDSIVDVVGAEYDTTYFDEPSRVHAIDGSTGNSLWSYNLLDGVRAMALADVSGDGSADVIVGASYASTTQDGRVHAIDGSDGSAIWTFANGATNSDVVGGDLNGDGFADAVVASFDDSVFAIDGATGSELWRTVIGGLWVNAVDTGRVNGDAFDDVAFAHEYLTGFSNHLGVLDGTDGSVIWQLTVPYVVLDTLLADVDADGQLEAVFGGATGGDRAWVYVRDAATGALEWEYELGAMDHVNGQVHLRAVDIDGDSDLDLVVGSWVGTKQVFAFEGDSATPLWISPTLESFTRDLAFGDVTGDSRMNVLAATGNRVQVLDAVDGTRSWYYAVGGSIASVAVGDLDGSGVLDVVAGGGAEFSGTPPDPGKSIWALRTTDSPLLWEYGFGQYGNALAVAELSGDSAEEVVTVSSLDDAAIVIDGATGLPLWTWTGTENLYTVTTGDFDGNGTIDVAVAGNDNTVTALYGNLGAVMWQFPTGGQVYRKCLASTDIDNDGMAEVIAGSDDNTIYAINGLDGALDWSVTFGGDIEEVELAQMDGAGPLDVVAAVGWPGNRVVVLDGADGSLLWEYATDVNYVNQVEVLDANNDGILDVGVAVPKIGATPGRVFVLDGGTRTELWSSSPMLPGSNYALAHGDLDGNGTEELVVAGNNDDRAVHALDGASGAELWYYLCGGDVNVVRVADLDGDGRNEVAAGADDQIVHVIDGCAGTAWFTFSTAGDVMDLRVGDISGDGRPNLAATTFDSAGVAYVFHALDDSVLHVDDADDEFFAVSGNWRSRAYHKAYAGATSFQRPGTGARRAAFRLDRSGGDPFIVPGTYDVYHWKFHHPRLAQMATNAPFKVYHKNGVSPWILLDQSQPGSEWQFLGTFEFDNDSEQGVLVSDNADGVVAVDALRLIRR